MSGIDKQRIENYYKGEYSSEEEQYMCNAFTQESNAEDLKTILNKQWDNTLPDNSDSHLLDHILYKLNYKINTVEGKHIERPLIKLINWYARIAAILLIPVLVYSGIVTYQDRKSAGAESWAEITAPLGARIKFNLPDGSYGWLNSGSTIKYALNFKQHREIQITGQAFFNVKHDGDNKFVVKTKYLDIEDLGTAFDVAAFAGEEDIQVTLEQGSVYLKNAHLNAPVEMKPNEHVSYNIAKHTITKTVVTAQNFSAWKEGKLMLRNASLEQLAKQLSRWYNVDVKIQDAQHADLRYRATFEDENLDEVLRLLKISSQLDFKIEERVKQANGSFTKQTVILKVK